MRCDGCKHWTVALTTLYDDGSRIDTFRAQESKGLCDVLALQTTPEFGCTSHAPAPDFDHVRVSRKAGEPWQHWHMGPCPDCAGKGSAGDGACHRCAGTSNVRYYDDGFVGDERSRRHPNEVKGQPVKPNCQDCGKEMELNWKACPNCGHRLEVPAKTEIVSERESMHVGKF